MSLFDRTLELGDEQRVHGFWNCFGRDAHTRVDEATVLGMVAAADACLLPLNTDRDELVVGHGDVTWQRFRPHAERLGLIPAVNVNLRTTVKEAVAAANLGWHQSGPEGGRCDLLKLEVLTDDLARSNDAACVFATEALLERGYRVMPLISCDPDVAIELACMHHDGLAVPLLRVIGSPIGSGGGIQDPEALEQITDLGLPVILDGGVGTVRHAQEALRFGCAGFLLNSCLFTHPAGPIRRLREFAVAFNPTLAA